ncbi:MAG TPA: sugar ABC transporter permease [Aggregatilineales bacterium]|nr:sugar ABC transporter permease [Anaerolineales bacterium]HRE47532.1 sugar ABC transporter permease [Aggregatilineales bacterium]
MPRFDTINARQTRLALLLLLPTFIVLILVAFYPLARTFTASLTDERFAAEEGTVVKNVNFQNYQRLLGIQFVQIPPDETRLPTSLLPRVEATDTYPRYTYSRVGVLQIFSGRTTITAGDGDFVGAILNTVFFTIVSVFLELSFGLGIALVVNTKFRGRGVMRAVMLIPWAIPTAVSTRLWKEMLGDNSSRFLNALLLQTGLIQRSQAWLVDFPFLSIILVDVWKTAPYMALLILAGLQTISADLYEAAAVDGTTVVQRFFRITFPLLMPTILIALIFRTLDALRAFDVFYVLFNRKLLSMASYNYEKLAQDFQYGYASAIGVVIFIIIFAFTILYMSTFQVQED